MTKQEEFEESIENSDIENVRLLLKDNNVNPADEQNWAIRYTSVFGYINFVKLLLKDKRVDPSDYANYAITHAYKNGHLNVVKLLWKDIRVKNTLQENDLQLYNKLMLQNKISEF